MNHPDTAPRDMTPFLGHFGYPWLLPTMWSPTSEQWVVATVQIGVYEGKFEDPYFEQDTEAISGLLGWIPLPRP